MINQSMTTGYFSLLLVLSNCFSSFGASYIYIQGDKITPFYVKLEGKMVERYGKNYCIIPNLKAGNHNIEILFQQNIFPAQKFEIQVPEDGCKGFLLLRRNDKYVLYDLKTKEQH